MRPLRLELDGFLSYAEPTSIDFSHVRAAAILGPNGAGKTSIVEAMGWSLYGKGRFRGPDDFVSVGMTDARVAFEFALWAGRFRVERQRHVGASSKSELVLLAEADLPPLAETDDHDGSSWTPVGGATIAETQAAIEQLVGMDFATWEATSYIAQGRADAFTQLTPAKRKELLADVLDLDRYSELEERAKARAHDVAVEASTARAGLEHVETDLAGAGDVDTELADAERIRTECEGRVGVLELDHEAATRRVDEARERARGVEGLREELEDLRARRASQARDLVSELDRAQRQRDDHLRAREIQAKAVAKLGLSVQIRVEIEAAAGGKKRELDEAQTAYTREVRLVAEAKGEADLAWREHEAHAERLVEADTTIETLSRSHDPSCPTCSQPLSANLRDDLIHTLTARADEARKANKAAHGQWDAAMARAGELQRRATALETRVADIRGELVSMQERIAVALSDEHRLPAEQHQLERMREQSDDLDEEVGLRGDAINEAKAAFDGKEGELARQIAEGADLQAAVTTATDQLADSQRELAAARRDLDGAGQQLGQLRAKAEAARGLRERQQLLTSEIARLTDTQGNWGPITEMFGRNGIPALVIENAIPALEASANGWLERLASGRLSVRIDSLRAKKTGGLRETLDITVADGEAERPLEGFSGGERQRVNLALRLALAELLAERAGRPIEALILDEAFTALDTEGHQLALEVIRALEDRFPLVLFVTHLDMGQAFPTQIEVSRNGEGSRVEVVST